MQTFNDPPRALHVSEREILLRMDIRRSTGIWDWRKCYAFVIGYTLHEVLVCLVCISEGASVGAILYDDLAVCGVVIPHFQAFLRT